MDQLLNYTALFVGAILAVLSTLFETSRTVDGRVTVTRVGVVFIVLIILALIVSVANWHASENEKAVLRQQIEGLREDIALERRFDQVIDRVGGMVAQQASFYDRIQTNIDQCLAIVQNGCEIGDVTGVMELNLETLQDAVENMESILEGTTTTLSE